MKNNTLTLYRRHQKSCGLSEPTLFPNDATARKADTCACAINVHGYLEHHVGRIRHYSLETSDWNKAFDKKIAMEKAGRLPSSESAAPTEVITVRFAVDTYLKARSQKIADSSIQGYEIFLRKRLLPWCKENRVDNLKELEVFQTVERFENSWCKLKDGEPLDDAMHNNQIQIFRTFFKYCIEKQEWITKNTAKRLEKKPDPDDDDAKKFGLSLHEYDNVLKTLEAMPKDLHTQRLRAIVELMRWTGMRISDATKFSRYELVRNDRDTAWRANFIQKKTKKRCVVIVPSEVAEMLFSLRYMLDDGGFWFMKYRPVGKRYRALTKKWYKQIVDLFADVQRIHGKFEHHATPHTLRDSAAIQWLNDGMSIQDVSKHLGHQNIMTTIKSYLHENRDAIEQREDASVAASQSIRRTILANSGKVTPIRKHA